MGAKILIADDESDIVSMLGSFFESKGFRVLPAFNGAEALKQVEKQPDIILLDINMPGKDGLEVYILSVLDSRVRWLLCVLWNPPDRANADSTGDAPLSAQNLNTAGGYQPLPSLYYHLPV